VRQKGFFYKMLQYLGLTRSKFDMRVFGKLRKLWQYIFFIDLKSEAKCATIPNFSCDSIRPNAFLPGVQHYPYVEGMVI
jgi:prephenate dehydratase